MYKVNIHYSQKNSIPETTGVYEDLQVSEGIEFQLSRDRDSASKDRVIFEDEDIFELEMEDGYTRFIRGDEFAEVCGQNQSKRDGGGASDELDLPDFWESGATSDRGFATSALKVIRKVGITIKGELVKGNFDIPELAVGSLAETWEEKHTPNQGLACLCDANGMVNSAGENDLPTVENISASESPVLILIHGTFSSTSSSFSGLWSDDNFKIWSEKAEIYKGQIYGYQHYTLARSPIENAIEILRALPANQRIHLVTHSRGGMIGELLSLPTDYEGAYTDWKLYKEDKYKEQKKQLATFQKLLREKTPRVERVVRVACPTRGTFLLNERLDNYLEIIFNLLKILNLSTGGAFGPTLKFVKSLTMACVKQRVNPNSLPGLEAMMPGSAIVSLINSSHIESASELCIISGETKGKGMFNKIRNYAIDLLAGEKNDLVVQSASMLGGIKRTMPVRYFHDDQGSTSHFNYFYNYVTAKKISGALTQQPDMAELGFAELEVKPPVQFDISRGFNDEEELEKFDLASPIVVVIPGIMGSNLNEEDKDSSIWINYKKIIFGGIKKMRIERKMLASGIHAGSYKNLYEFLDDNVNVLAFPYDWRLSLQTEASRLIEKMEELLKLDTNDKQPIHVICHSMGGLLMRTAIFLDKRRKEEEGKSLTDTFWHQMATRRQGRYLMLGTPTLGSHGIFKMLLGQDKSLKMISAADIFNSKKDILKIISKYPGVLEMLPADENTPLNFFDLELWKKFMRTEQGDKVALPRTSDLQKARETRALIDRELPYPDNVYYVAGQALSTPINTEIDEREIRIFATTEGDERVPWKTGFPKGIPASNRWYMPGVGHGDLANIKSTFHGLLDLVIKGTTRQNDQVLTREKPGVNHQNLKRSTESTGEGDNVFDIHPTEHTTFRDREDQISLYPSEGDFENLLMSGIQEKEEMTEEIPPVKLEIIHGDLSYVKNQYIMVGHSANESITGPEWALNKSLGYVLLKRKTMDTYPGPQNTLLQVKCSSSRKGDGPAGGIILGLGDLGDVNTAYLISIVEKGLMNYAANCMDQCASNDPHASEMQEVTTVFIGKTLLSLEESIISILRGVKNANFKLNKLKYSNEFCLRGINFTEYYEDVAVQAAHMLKRILRNDEFKHHFTFNNRIRSDQDQFGNKRISFETQRNGWEKIRILCPNNDEQLTFDLYSGSARITADNQRTNASLISGMLKQAIRGHKGVEIGFALFELLFPNRLKDYLFNRPDLIFIVDHNTAKYPWELMIDRNTEKDIPLSVQAGMIRQLRTTHYRQKTVISSSHNALVIGDPDLQGWDKFKKLKAAEKEAIEVTKQLTRKGFDVNDLIDASGSDIISTLFSSDYQILHFAAHGVVDFDTGTNDENEGQSALQSGAKKNLKTGMVIGQNLILTPSDINQMRQVPELVFINCCHLGSTVTEDSNERFNELAANLGTQLIEMGVTAAVVAGWAVNDDDALTFAREFYEAMFNHEDFGRAVQIARKKVYETGKGQNTWGAYQCYGDPEFTLKGRKYKHKKDGSYDFVASSEAAVELENLGNRIDKAGSDIKLFNYYLKKLEAVKSAIKEMGWSHLSKLNGLIGKVHYRAGQYKEAIRYYEMALRDENAQLSLQAAENYANAIVKDAWDDYSAGAISATKGFQRVNGVISKLKAIIEIAPTSERYNLLGSAYKRAAAMRSTSKTSLLKSMFEAYQEAEKIALGRTENADDPGSRIYSSQNRLTAQWIQSMISKNSKKAVLIKELKEMILESEEKNAKAKWSKFWDMVETADLRSLLLIIAPPKSAKAKKEALQQWKEIEDKYFKARRLGSRFKFKAITNQMEIILALVEKNMDAYSRDQFKELHKNLIQSNQKKRS